MATTRKKAKTSCARKRKASRKTKSRTGGSFILKVRPEKKRGKTKK